MIHTATAPRVDRSVCEPVRLFARHVSTSTWHLVCSGGEARCNRTYRLDTSRQVEVPPDSGKPCWACIVNSGFYNEFEVRRALHRWKESQRVQL